MRRLALIVVALGVLLAGCGGHASVRLRVIPLHRLAACASSDCGGYAVTMTWGVFPPWGHTTTGYNVYCTVSGAACNGTPYGTTTGTSFTVTGMDCGKTLTLGVQAHDSGSDVSQTASTGYATPACPTPSGPTVNFFVAQTSAGSGAGTSCANASAVSTLSTATHWTPGNVIGLCGTITSAVTAQGSGTSGSPITVYFEPNAAMTESAPTCTPNGCINLNSKNYITLNGGANGVIQVTDNGDQLAFADNTGGVVADNTDHATIENLAIEDMYVKHANVAGTLTASGISATNATNVVIDHNTITQSGTGIWTAQTNATVQNITISNNDISDVNWGIVTVANANDTIGPEYIFGNHLHDFANWDTSADTYHHDGVFCYTGGSGFTPTYTAYDVYNNLFGPNIGNNATSWIFLENCGSDSNVYYAFNNIFEGEGGNGAFAPETGIDLDYNNTFLGSQGYSFYDAYSGQHDQRNNLALNDAVGEPTRSGCGGTPPSGFSCPHYTLNNNLYANSQSGAGFGQFVCPATNTILSWNTGWSSWLSCLGANLSAGGSADTNSFGPPGSSQTVTDPKLDSNDSPTVGSAALGAGQNLYSICNGQPNPGLGALCSTYGGPAPSGTGAGPSGQFATPSARPSSAAWNIGAY